MVTGVYLHLNCLTSSQSMSDIANRSSVSLNSFVNSSLCCSGILTSSTGSSSNSVRRIFFKQSLPIIRSSVGVAYAFRFNNYDFVTVLKKH